MAEKYDDVSWHFSDEHSEKAASIHIAFYLTWAVLRGLALEEFDEDTSTSRVRLAERSLTPGQYFEYVFAHGKLSSHSFGDEGRSFSSECYREFLRRYSLFAEGLCSPKREIRKSKFRQKIGLKPRRSSAATADPFYQVKDTWKNFDSVAKVLDRLLAEWRSGTFRKHEVVAK